MLQKPRKTLTFWSAILNLFFSFAPTAKLYLAKKLLLLKAIQSIFVSKDNLKKILYLLLFTSDLLYLIFQQNK
jgi:hypothetical protein